MFESKPELKETFASFKGKNVDELHNTGLLRKHALRVMSTIDKCIARLDQPSSMTSTLRNIGVHHMQYKVPIEYLEVILPHFLVAIKPHIEAFWCDDLEHAWTRLFDMILFHIREGMFQSDKYDTMSISGTVS
ncbi:uncharacterized protein LOC132739721 [Ruditapes philippinarum]|uniref:uncharacterized protein LOC132739721 n=1 Tax=Ruditapes philippinarum TaxID=129788 RepID=UPI00295AF154|nr:uncharacterized protein LOC132739721 [Ruditapes philippinarum]